MRRRNTSRSSSSRSVRNAGSRRTRPAISSAKTIKNANSSAWSKRRAKSGADPSGGNATIPQGRKEMSMPQMESETRRTLNPLFNDNKLKLGPFGVNVSNGYAITTVDGRHKVTCPTNLAIAQTADRYGYEALVPVARWRGFGSESNFNGTNFETHTWAAALGQATNDISVLTTSHVPTIHPIVAAKQATTVDHIPNGRFALNIVCGWFTP